MISVANKALCIDCEDIDALAQHDVKKQAFTQHCKVRCAGKHIMRLIASQDIASNTMEWLRRQAQHSMAYNSVM